MHRDNVPSLPEGFELLGSTAKCPVHGMVRYAPGVDPSKASLEQVSIIALQGESTTHTPLPFLRARRRCCHLSPPRGRGAPSRSPRTRPETTDPEPSTFAGHPEFNSKIVNEVIAAREEKGVLTPEVANESRENADQHDDGQYIARVFLAMFGL